MFSSPRKEDLICFSLGHYTSVSERRYYKPFFESCQALDLEHFNL